MPIFGPETDNDKTTVQHAFDAVFFSVHRTIRCVDVVHHTAERISKIRIYIFFSRYYLIHKLAPLWYKLLPAAKPAPKLQGASWLRA